MAYKKKKKDGIYYDRDKCRIMEHHGYVTKIHWTPQMIADLKRWFSTTLNEELAEILGVSARTVTRKARELGLNKNPEWLKSIWNERRILAHAESKRMGYPGKFPKGHIPHNKGKNKITEFQYE